MPPQPENEAVNEEAGLLAQTGRGDREAFRQLYARFSAPLFSLALRLVGDSGEAEELLQDAFVKIWRNAGSYDSRKSRPFTWAVTILRRTGIDRLRKRRRVPESCRERCSPARGRDSGGFRAAVWSARGDFTEPAPRARTRALFRDDPRRDCAAP